MIPPGLKWGDRIKAATGHPRNCHIVGSFTLSGNVVALCGRRFFRCLNAKKTMPTCRKCLDSL